MTEKTEKRMIAAAQFAASLCMYAGESQTFYDAFWKRLLKHKDILEEFVYFMERQDFLCRAKVEGRTVVDIMVWQIDHFKANLDRDQADMRLNKDKMVLYAFDTMTKAAEEPSAFINKMETETGTEYQGKFFGL
ncbi:MAG: hypothetical protein Q4C58_15875 [Eubacteriales bacterium]|nr:hypothetical protein [Eubacteriales bacterium]